MENALGPCRLNYELYENNSKIDNGYLLSTRDLLGLEHLPFLIKCGVTSFKIEGRLKNPEYVATVTRIYRKYIDLVISGENFEISEQDKKDLLQVFNRGLSSSGHLEKEPNKKLVYKLKPNNMGLPLGIIQKYNKNKGYITLKLKEKLEVGDTISIDNEEGSYTVSELMEDSNGKLKNIDLGIPGKTVTIGRMKGNISIKDKVFKISSKQLSTIALNSINLENRKIPLSIKITIKKNKPISAIVKSSNEVELYKDLNIQQSLDVIPVDANNKPLTNDDVIKQISKTGNTPFEFKNIEIIMDDNVFLPKLSSLNELRRNILEEVENFAIKSMTRKTNTKLVKDSLPTKISSKSNTISVLLNTLNLDFDYSKLENIDNIYIPLKYFAQKKYSNLLSLISSKFNLYIYLPTIIKANYRNMFYSNIENAVNQFKIHGIILSHVSNFVLLNDLPKDIYKNLDLVANFTFNIYNNQTLSELKKFGVSRFTISPELDKETIFSLIDSGYTQELISYGKTPIINMNYCVLGQTNKCYPGCDAKCRNTDNRFYLKDRLNMNFEIIPDNVQTVTTVYNSKILSLSPSEFNCNYFRIDIIHESIDEINNIVNTISSGKRLEGKEYTNGNLNRII